MDTQTHTNSASAEAAVDPAIEAQKNAASVY